ncbi:MAG: polyribonucleotide nucleotidyltransferase [Candidatus Omnitrophota bacterium]
MKENKYSVGFGREELVITSGKMAKQADGACTIQYGGTLVLVTAVISKEPRDEGFLPLSVDYLERTYAAGKIPGGFFRREGRPSEKEILTCRLTDRPIRSLFPEGFTNEVQIVSIVLSHDGQNDPDILSLNGASTALMMSGVPFGGPVGACRVAMVDGKFMVNPTYAELEKSSMDLIVAGTRSGVIMIEAGAKEVPEELMLEAIKFGHSQIQAVIDLQERVAKSVGKPKMDVQIKTPNEELYTKIKEKALEKLKQAYSLDTKDRREEAVDLIAKDLKEIFVTESSQYTEQNLKDVLVKLECEEVRRMTLDKKLRVDGRAYGDIRPITCEVGILPRTHGSGLFTRGQTQALAVTTLGTASDAQRIDALAGETFKSFMLHYSFPPFSVGEIKPIRGPGRREIGHGALAERSLYAVIPSKEEFPYTLRIVSEILESNGSSSMATVCAATLSLMDAGVPIKAPVAGIAMGLIKEKDKYVILTDIGGIEDHFGDMDFKVAGTRKGVTAMQLDIKTDSISEAILTDTMAQTKKARMAVLDKMEQTLACSRETLSVFAPRIVTLKINTEKIRDVIGPGGKIIRKIIADTGVSIDIEEDGTVMVASTEAEAMEKALDIIRGLTQEPEVGKIYTGKITRIMPFGAFCEILPQREGLIHVSELADKYVKNVDEVVKIGDTVTVKLIEIDEQGRLNLSRKQAEK